ncbi:hypothetical protein V6R21_03005 [Limibacter armeniacum]|uniref:hypothetical protein n=1 Tax=Limibacter armeniacum TaxID=466084 RepID=UPI002FE54BBD
MTIDFFKVDFQLVDIQFKRSKGYRYVFENLSGKEKYFLLSNPYFFNLNSYHSIFRIKTCKFLDNYFRSLATVTIILDILFLIFKGNGILIIPAVPFLICLYVLTLLLSVPYYSFQLKKEKNYIDDCVKIKGVVHSKRYKNSGEDQTLYLNVRYVVEDKAYRYEYAPDGSPSDWGKVGDQVDLYVGERFPRVVKINNYGNKNLLEILVPLLTVIVIVRLLFLI